MSDSIGRINLNAWASDPDKPKTPIEAFDAGARAVALHVLEIACPGSPILAAMKAGASFEEAVERERVRKDAWCATCSGGHYPPGVICPTCSGSGVDPAKAAVAREAMSRAAERIDEPTETEFAAAASRCGERRAVIPAGFNPPKIVLGPGGCGEEGCVKPFGHESHCSDSDGVPIVETTVGAALFVR